jgi:hypothetical protein
MSLEICQHLGEKLNDRQTCLVPCWAGHVVAEVVGEVGGGVGGRLRGLQRLLADPTVVMVVSGHRGRQARSGGGRG